MDPDARTKRSRLNYVTKRNGQKEPISFDKITRRLDRLVVEHEISKDVVDINSISQEVIMSLVDGIETAELDKIAARVAISRYMEDPDYEKLAKCITVSNMHKQAPKTFSKAMDLAFFGKLVAFDTNTNANREWTCFDCPKISKEFYDFVQKHAQELDNMIVLNRDNSHSYFGIMTVIDRGYLLKGKTHNKQQVTIETIQYAILRQSIAKFMPNLSDIQTDYEYVSNKFFTHGTPCWFNAGTNNQQLSSCYVLDIDDSLEDIYEELKKCALILKGAGGVGINVSKIRSSGAPIRKENGTSKGIIPMLQVYAKTAEYVDQGGSKRKGAIAIYIEPWHSDIMDFLDLKLNDAADETRRSRTLFTAVWLPDYFMHCVKYDLPWFLMDPLDSPGLSDVFGEVFDELYHSYITQGRYRNVIKARDVFNRIILSQGHSGMPYVLFKDAANRKSNQQNCGIIRSSNLCAEIMLNTQCRKHIAVCNLASVCLPMFVHKTTAGVTFDWEKLQEVTRWIVRSSNQLMDINEYPSQDARDSNMDNRPIGIGVQGLADVFILFEEPFTSDNARMLNRKIFETMYFAALTESCELAKKHGPYKNFQGSPAHQGKLQFDLWKDESPKYTVELPWKELKEHIQQHGLRNSTLMAAMPTASTSQIMGNNECFEPFTSNCYIRKTRVGDFVVVNKHLVQFLKQLGVWNTKTIQHLKDNDGSVQDMDEIPDKFKEIFRTAWEIKPSRLITMAAERGPFIDQSQSLNLFVKDFNNAQMIKSLQYAWEKGLKTGVYYARSQSAVKPFDVTSHYHVGKKKTQHKQSSEEESSTLGCGDACSA